MSLIVRAYVCAGQTFEFPARDRNNAREIAHRIVTEGLWTEAPEETFYPANRVFKVRIIEVD